MTKKYRVTVSPGYRWNTVTVAGRHFAKSSETIVADGEPGAGEILNSQLLSVIEVKPPRKKKAASDEVDDDSVD